MEPTFRAAIPVLPAADTTESLKWWTEVCGFEEYFRDATPPGYAGIRRGDAVLHISAMGDKALAKTVGEQVMVRIRVEGIETFFAEFQKRGGALHPNSSLHNPPWGGTEFTVLDPNGICVTFLD